MTGTGSQLHKHEVQGGIIDEIVAFVIQFAVDEAQKPHDLFHGQGILQHIDIDDPAKLPQSVALILRIGQKTPFDPVLHHVAFQGGDAADLAQGNIPGHKHGREQLPRPAGIASLDLQGCTRYCPVHLLHCGFLL